MTLTLADLRMLRLAFEDAHLRGRLRDEDYRRTVVVLHGAQQAMRELDEEDEG